LARVGGDGPSLAGGGSLGGSLAGMRLLYRIDRSLALSGRLYLPVRRPEDAELAGGLDWQPLRTAPIHLLAERRQALGRDGRSAFSLTVYGGLSQSLPGRMRLDAYGQAGLVGLRTRDAFADGAIRLSRPFGRLDIGGGAWGAAQPGAARFDAGPTLALRLPALHARLEADWRFRLAGGAAPGSGPALVLAADF
jgi:hypothetical protein